MTTSGLLVLVLGCGGSGSTAGSAPAALAGDNAAEGAAVASAKALSAGASVPFAVLQTVSAPQANVRGPRSGPILVPALGLYEVSTTSGSNLTLALFRDSAGTQAAGSISVASSEPYGSTYTYPVTFTAKANITGGSLPMNGSFTVKLEDSKGKNELNGSLNLTADSIGLTFNVAADDTGALQSSGTMGVTYANTAVKLTQLSGSALTKIDAAAEVTYNGVDGMGTAELNLPTNSFVLSVQSGNLAILAQMTGASNTLSLTLPSGISKVINDPSSFVLSSLVGTGGTTGGTSGPSIAVMNALTDSADAAVNITYGTTSLGALGDGAVSFEYPVTAGSNSLRVTRRSGGQVDITRTTVVDSASRYIIALVGDPQDGYYSIQQKFALSPAKPDSSHSWLTLFHGVAGLTETTDFYVVPKGTSIANSKPLWSGAVPLTSQTFNLINITSGSWTIVATEPGSPTSVIASGDITLAPGVSTVATLVSPNNQSAKILSDNDPGPAK